MQLPPVRSLCGCPLRRQLIQSYPSQGYPNRATGPRPQPGHRPKRPQPGHKAIPARATPIWPQPNRDLLGPTPQVLKDIALPSMETTTAEEDASDLPGAWKKKAFKFIQAAKGVETSNAEVMGKRARPQLCF